MWSQGGRAHTRQQSADGTASGDNAVLTEDEKREIAREVGRSHDPRAACIGALRVVQAHRGWVSDESLHGVAALLGMSPSELEGVATFYNLVFRHPVGKHVLKVCDGAVCWILGGQTLMEYLEQRLGVRAGGTSDDGVFTLLPICCVGDCDHAPVMMVDSTMIRNLTPQVVDEVLARYRARAG
jgi:NADH-quinone oxidoreductase subunit E